MKSTESEPQQPTGPLRHILRWRFRGASAESDYAAVLERMLRQGWRELGRWGGPEDFVVELGGETMPDWGDTVLAAGSLR